MNIVEIATIGIAGWATIEVLSLPFTLAAYRKMNKTISDAKDLADRAKAEVGLLSGQLSEVEGYLHRSKREVKAYIDFVNALARVAHVDKNECIHVRGKKTGRFESVKFEIIEKE